MRALKRLTIDRPPNVLVFQLKRFEYMFHGSKITKKVQPLVYPLMFCAVAQFAAYVWPYLAAAPPAIWIFSVGWSDCCKTAGVQV